MSFHVKEGTFWRVHVVSCKRSYDCMGGREKNGEKATPFFSPFGWVEIWHGQSGWENNSGTGGKETRSNWEEREREREEIKERPKLSKRESFGVGSTDIRIVESTAVRMRRTDSSTSFLNTSLHAPPTLPTFSPRHHSVFPWAQYALSQPKRCTIHLSFSTI